VKRLGAEQMLDAISQFTETSEKFRSIIPEPYSNWPANFKAAQISDGNTECSFLDLFGRPPRDTPYEEERNSGRHPEAGSVSAQQRATGRQGIGQPAPQANSGEERWRRAG